VANSEAIAVSVNSSGGLPVQSHIIAKKLKSFAKKHHLKLLTFGGEIVASGGYLILAQGDEVYCDVSSAIGSIGISIPKYDINAGLQYFSLEHKRLRSNEYSN
jgi:serine protease SohB